jgi:hypothetical protein
VYHVVFQRHKKTLGQALLNALANATLYEGVIRMTEEPKPESDAVA